MKKLSIVIPVYNIDDWLLIRCLDSISKQDLKKSDYEVIIIDDGSNAKVEIPDRLQDLLPIKIIHQENKGVGGARNSGISLAKGKYLIFIDPDDYIFPYKLKSLLKRCDDMSLDCLYYAYKKVSSDYIEHSNSDCCKTLFRGSGAEYLLKNNLLGVCWQFIYKTSLLKNNGVLTFEEHIFHEDELFMPLWLIKAEQIEIVDAELYAYYYRGESITTSATTASIEKRRKDFLYVIKTLEKIRHNGSLSALQSKALHRRITYLTADYIITGLRSSTISEVKKRHIQDLRKEQLFPIRKIKGERKLRIFSLLSRCYLGLWLIKHIDKLR